MNNQIRSEIFRLFQQQNPNPTTELIYHNNFELLISVLLSAQATDISVNKATKNLFAIANNPVDMLKLGEDGIIQYIKSIGLYKAKAKNIIKTCEKLIYNFNKEVPNSQTDLESLAGVGRKTANVVRNTAFGEPTIAVDTHIFRVANRTNLASGKDVLEVELKLLKTTPQKFKLNAHHWLILHGRYTCKARKPLCKICIIKHLCEYKDKEL